MRRAGAVRAFVNCNALLGGALLLEEIVGALTREGLIETKPIAGRERCGRYALRTG